jgi:RNA polymerase sigma factor for flagellar operon FliA
VEIVKAMTTEHRKPPAKIEPMTAAQKRLVSSHLALVDRIAHKLHRRSPEFEMGDLVHYGCEGLIAAAKAYDADKGIPFEMYAHHRVRGAIQDGIRVLVGYNHALRDRHAAEKRVELARQRQQSLSETLERLAEFVEQNPAPRRAGLVEAAAVADAHASPETNVHLARIADQVRAAAASLETTERRLVEGLYFEDKTLDQASAKAGVSKGWGSRKHARALGRMREILARGADASPREAPLPAGGKKKTG